MGAVCCANYDPNTEGQVNKEIGARMQSDHKELQRTHRIVLLGPGESGKSTILKQMTKIYRGAITKDTLFWAANKIKTEVAMMIKALCIANEELKIDLEKTNDNQDIKAIRTSLSKLHFETLITPEIVSQMKLLWANKGIQETLEQRHKFQIPDHVAYFLDSRLDDIYLSDHYLPTFDDYLRLRVRSTGFYQETFHTIIDKEITLHKPECVDSQSSAGNMLELMDAQPPNVVKGTQHTFIFIDVGGQRCERRKWFGMLQDEINCAVYVVAVSEYDMTCFEDNETPRITEALQLFETVLKTGLMEGRAKTFSIFLNKYDLLVQKLQDMSKGSFKDYFDEFPDDKDGRDPSHVCEYVYQQFNAVFHKWCANGELHRHCTSAIDTNQIQNVFMDITFDLIKSRLMASGMN